jgi:methionine--tRNA ligase beta chain
MKNLIDYNYFDGLDIRVGQVVESDLPEWSDKLIRYVVDLGNEIERRVLFSGIREWYTPEDLLGKKLPVIINMKPKKMGQEISEGMALMIDSAEKPVMIFLSDEALPGDVVK